MSDRLFLFLATIQKEGTHNRTSFIDTPEALAKARKQWDADGTGSLAGYFLPQLICFLKCDKALESEEFKGLDGFTQKALLAETKPTFEIIFVSLICPSTLNIFAISSNPSPHCMCSGRCIDVRTSRVKCSHIEKCVREIKLTSHPSRAQQVPNPMVPPPDPYLGYVHGFQGTDGAGEVRLHSADPKDKPEVDPKYLSTPFDRRLAIESLRQALDLLDKPNLAQDHQRFALGPKGRSDEEILVSTANTITIRPHPFPRSFSLTGTRKFTGECEKDEEKEREKRK